MKAMFIKYLKITGICLFIGYALLLLVFLLPVTPMKNNLKEDITLFENEGYYNQMIEGYKSTQLDNYTDIIMLMNAIYDGPEPFYQKAFANYRYNDSDLNNIDELSDYLNEGITHGTSTYSWYAHGYLVILKVLLLFMGYSGIRILGCAATLLVIALSITGFIKKNLPELIIPYLMAVFVINPVAVSMSLQYSSAWYTMHALLLWLLYFWNTKDSEKLTSAFFITGIGIAYFDFLTYPLVVYGIPICVVIYEYYKKTDITYKNIVKTIITSGISFLAGYIILFISKWILGIIAAGPQVIASITEHVSERMSSTGMDYEIHRYDAILKNLDVLNHAPYIFILIISLLAFAAFYLYKKRKPDFDKRLVIPSILIFLSPFVWFMALANHSHAHYFFTYRIISIAIFVLYMLICSNLVSDKNSQ